METESNSVHAPVLIFAFDCQERYLDLRSRKFDVIIDRRHDPKESYTDIPRKQRLTSHETESKSLLLKKMDTSLDRERSEHKTTSDERIRSDYQRRDGAETMRQSSRRRETESAYWAEEKKTTKDWVFDIEKKYNRSLSQICDGIAAGYNRAKMIKRLEEKEQRHGQEGLKEQRQREKNTEGQRREPQENVKEHRQRDTTGWQRYFERKRREAQENAHEHRQKETSRCQRYSEKKRKEAQENVQKQRLMEIPENHNVDNLQVERQRESIKWQTREAQEMERRKSKAFLEEQRVKDKLDKKRQRDAEKLEIEAEESSQGKQRLKENTILDSQVNERFEEIRSQMIDETLDGFKRARMEKALPDFQGLEKFKDISQIHDEIVEGYIRARKMVKTFEETVEKNKD